MSALKAGHRFGIVLAAIPVTISAYCYFGSEQNLEGAKVCGIAGLSIYLLCLGIGWGFAALIGE